MARSARGMADYLIELYRDRGKRYRMSTEAFKRCAGKTRLRSAFLQQVENDLREDGFLLVDMIGE